MSEEPGLRLWMLAPAAGAAVVLAVFFLGLQREDARDLPSALLNRPSPEFALAPLNSGAEGLATADMKAPGVKLVNIWASWCGPCRIEHPQIEALAAQGITVHGINHKDAPGDARRFLAELGDPYTRIGVDRDGRAGIEWGVYGVPETFVVDGNGVILYKHIGPVMPEDIEAKILPAITQAQNRD